MPSFLYKPGHIHANENGFVTTEDYYTHKYMTEPDLRMMVGNEPVKIYYSSDEMAPTVHMMNGKLYTSKKRYRDETKARGCIEVGNDKSITRPRKPRPLDRRQRREDIKKAIYDLKNK